jgi:hypothetical protein
MGQAGPNANLLAAMTTTASKYMHGSAPRFALQHRHPGEGHWQNLGLYPTKELANEAAKAFVAAGYGDVDDFRVQRWKGPANA